MNTTILVVPILDTASVPGDAAFVGGWVENGAPVVVFAVSYDAMPLPDVQIWARPLEAYESLTVHHAYGVIGQWLIHT